MRVLIVEDNQRHAELIADELQEGGVACEVEWVETGAEALRRVSSAVYDIVVLDFRLADMDGIEIMEEIRNREIDVAVIFVTTADSVQLAVEAMKLGAEDFLQKQEGYLTVLPFLVREALERRRLRQDKRRLEHELRQAERLASVGVLAAGLAHNINNRLTSLKTFFDLFPDRHEDEYFRTDFLATCRVDLEKIALLVQELTRYALHEGPPRVPQSLPELVVRAINHLDDEIRRKHLRVHTEFPDVPRLPLDTEGVKQLFINILKNAIQASPDSGDIFVSLSVETDGDPHVVVKIRDNGPGLPPELRERVFDPFFTTKDHGLGVGLYICHKIAAQHRGRIEALSTEGSGATFAVYLPVGTPSLGAGAAAHAAH